MVTRSFRCSLLLIAGVLPLGCRHTETALMCHARDHAVDAFDAAERSLPRTPFTTVADSQIAAPSEPVTDLDGVDYWELTLADCIRIAVTQSKIIRTLSGVEGGAVLTNPDGMASVFDRRIEQSGVLFGQRGQDAALADFDPVIELDALWGAAQNVQNSPFTAGGLAPGGVLDEDTTQVSLSLSQRLPAGGNLQLFQTFNYDANNAPSRLFASAYNTNAQVLFRQPLLAGSGIDYNSVAGPLSGGVRGITGVSQGITIARINESISKEEFRRSAADLLRDVEISYWQLHREYAILAILKPHLARAKQSKKILESRARQGERGTAVTDMASSINLMLTLESRIDDTTHAVLEREATLRKLMSVAPLDKTILKPCETPKMMEFGCDWSQLVTTAMLERSELRIRREQLRSLDCQICAARNVMRPSLDFVSSYSLNGFGDDVLGSGGSGNLGSALGRQFAGQETGWNVGFQFEKQLGLRVAKSQLTNLQFRRAREAAVLKVQEEEIVSELASKLRRARRAWNAATNLRARLEQAEKQVAAVTVLYKANGEGITRRSVLDAETVESDVREQLETAMVDYNIAVTDLNHASCESLSLHALHIQD